VQDQSYRDFVRQENRLRQMGRENARAERIDDRLGRSGPVSTAASEAVGDTGGKTELAGEVIGTKVGGEAGEALKAVGRRAGIAGTLGEAAISTYEEYQTPDSADLDVIIAGKLARIGSVGAVTAGSTLAAAETGPAAPVIGFVAGESFDETLGDKLEAGVRQSYVEFLDVFSNLSDYAEEVAANAQDYLLSRYEEPPK